MSIFIKEIKVKNKEKLLSCDGLKKLSISLTKGEANADFDDFYKEHKSN